MKRRPWFDLKAMPVCRCGRPVSMIGLMQPLQADRNHRPGPNSGVISSSVASLRLECWSCKRSWDQRFLCVDRYERGPFGPPSPTDCYPLEAGQTPEALLQAIMEERKKMEDIRKAQGRKDYGNRETEEAGKNDDSVM